MSDLSLVPQDPASVPSCSGRYDYDCIENPVTREVVIGATREILAIYRQTAQNIVEMGKLFNKAKDALGHGEWMKWYETEFKDGDIEKDLRTVERWMKAAQNFTDPKFDILSNLHIKTLVELADLPDEVRVEAASLLTDGWSAKDVGKMISEERRSLKAGSGSKASSSDASSASGVSDGSEAQPGTGAGSTAGSTDAQAGFRMGPAFEEGEIAGEASATIEPADSRQPVVQAQHPLSQTVAAAPSAPAAAAAASRTIVDRPAELGLTRVHDMARMIVETACEANDSLTDGFRAMEAGERGDLIVTLEELLDKARQAD